MQVVFPLIAAFMPVYPAYVAMRFFCGAGSAGGISVLYVVCKYITLIPNIVNTVCLMNLNV